MKLSKARVLACAAAAAVAPLLLLAPAAAQAHDAPWTVVPSPNASPGNNLLASVASVSARDVWAVGSADDANGNTHTLTEHWNGTAWTIIPSPTGLTGTLSAVATVSSRDVWAAGSILLSGRGKTAQFEHWNGSKWRVVQGPAGPFTVHALTAVSSRDIWAVGSSLTGGTTAQTLIEHFDGHTWSVVPSPDASTGNNLLSGVAAVSSSDVWAVGDFQNASNVFQTLAEHWDGTAWSVVPSPSGAGIQAGLNAVAAVSSHDVWAVGNSGSGTLTERWNGTSWNVVPSPTLAGTLFNPLFGVAIISGSEIWAVGESQNGTTGSPTTLTEEWNGHEWELVPSPSPGSAATLSAAAASPESERVWAVGNATAPVTGVQQTLTELNGEHEG
jgi:hypothetical protein